MLRFSVERRHETSSTQRPLVRTESNGHLTASVSVIYEIANRTPISISILFSILSLNSSCDSFSPIRQLRTEVLVVCGRCH